VTPSGALAPIITSVSPLSSTLRDPNSILLTINGQFFQNGAVVSLGPGVAILDNPAIFISALQLQVNIIVDTVANGIPIGTVFDVTVTNPDGGTATFPNAFTAN
jgi:hypothetical protein